MIFLVLMTSLTLAATAPQLLNGRIVVVGLFLIGVILMSVHYALEKFIDNRQDKQQLVEASSEKLQQIEFALQRSKVKNCRVLVEECAEGTLIYGGISDMNIPAHLLNEWTSEQLQDAILQKVRSSRRYIQPFYFCLTATLVLSSSFNFLTSRPWMNFGVPVGSMLIPVLVWVAFEIRNEKGAAVEA